MSGEVKDGNRHKMSACCNEALENRCISRFGGNVKQLRIPFFAKLHDFFPGKMRLSNILGFTRNEIVMASYKALSLEICP